MKIIIDDYMKMIRNDNYILLPENNQEWDDLSSYLFYESSVSKVCQRNYTTLFRYREYLYGREFQFINDPVTLSKHDGRYIIRKMRKDKLNKIYANQ